MFQVISLMTYIHIPGRIFDNLTTRTMSNHWLYTQMFKVISLIIYSRDQGHIIAILYTLFQIISLIIYTRVPGHIIDKIRTSSMSIFL